MIDTHQIAGYFDGKPNAVRMVHEQLCRFLGMAPRWPKEAGVSGETDRIVLPENLNDEQAVLTHAVRIVYDIEQDGSLLRSIVRPDPEARARFFSSLRAGYRVRREFFHFRADLSPRRASAVESLRRPGFLVPAGAEMMP